MDGFHDSSYGDAFADVYDQWYAGISDVDATVTDLVDLADGGSVLELGVGTGRLALPLVVALGHGADVVGVDSSVAMLARLHDLDADGRVRTVTGDMVDDVPDGPFALVVIAYNTMFSLTTAARQAACFATVAARLRPGGRFVVEAFVPEDPPRDGDDVAVRTITVDRVVLSVSRHDAGRQLAEGQFVEFTESGGVRLRPWAIRYSSPAQLDAMAVAAGFELEHRWEAFGRSPFHDDSPRHVSVYRR